MGDYLAEAVQLYLDGYMPLPLRPDGTKAPAVATWSTWQRQRPELEELEAIFAVDHDGLGVLCGTISGELEMFELEGRAVTEGLLNRLQQLMAEDGQAELWRAISTGWVELTPSGGVHYHYRVDGKAARNTRLAWRPSTPEELVVKPQERRKVLIETRGEGGFTVVAPSAGRSHPTGAAWRILTGSPATAPVLTVEQRDALYAIAQQLDQCPTETPQPSTTGRGLPPTGGDATGRPGDDFNDRYSWADILGAAGWQATRRFGHDRLGWTRPGKNPRDGISATTGGAADGVDRLYVFSSSAAPFEPETPYTKFAAWALLNTGGDFAEAARVLRRNGFGAPRDPAAQLDGLIDPDSPRTPAPEPARNPDEVPLADPDPVDDARAQPPAPPTLTVITGGAEAPTEGTAALKIDQDGSDVPASIAITLTDTGNADLMVARHAHRLRYVPARGQWIRWDGMRWGWCDDIGEAIQAATDTVRAIAGTTDAVKAFKTKSLSRRGLEAMASLASRNARARVAAETLDADPWILNTPSGTIDLRTGLLRPHSPDDNCTKVTGVPHAPGAAAPRWQAFLDETFAGDTGMVRFFQRLAGYSALGIVTHHVLPFLHGEGGNGKGVATEVLLEVLGDYASTAPHGFLMAGKDDESAIARLAGLRLVVTSEVNQRSRFDEAKVKLLTGGDHLTARFLYGRHFTFRPSHTLWLMGNHQPRVEAGGESFWRRLRLVPFTNTVPEEKKVEGLARELVDAEGSAILDWIVAGALEVQRLGLAEPEGVVAATARYAESEDALGRFVDDRLHLGGGPAARVDTAEMRTVYARWCRAEGETEVTPQVLGRELGARWSIGIVKSNGKRFYTGCTLLTDEAEADPEPHWNDR